MQIGINTHDHYNYMDSSIIEGLQILGHEVSGTNAVCSNYIQHLRPRYRPIDLFIQCVAGKGPLAGRKSVALWGEDSPARAQLPEVFEKGFDLVFVRDHVPCEPGIPMNFAAETRFYCATIDGPKPLNERKIDVTFLGNIGYGNRKEYVNRLKKDFSHLNLLVGERQFNTPDDKYSRWTLPYCAHDPLYFEALNNSKIILDFRGAGPDCARLYEGLASGAVVIAETHAPAEMVLPAPAGIWWFDDYDALNSIIDLVLHDLDFIQQRQVENWEWNREHHSSKARAKYLIDCLGMA